MELAPFSYPGSTDRPGRFREYPFNDHEGGEGFHDLVKMRWLSERLGR